MISWSSFVYCVGITTCAYYLFIVWWKLISGFRGYLLPRFARQSNADLANKYGKWAVVTGATDGIGLAYARELAARKVNIVLISRSEEKLVRISDEIENEFLVQTKFIVADFTEGRSVYKKIEDELRNIPVGILVNNVGMAPSKILPVVRMTEKLISDMVDVNIVPLLMMTKMLLPQMEKNEKGAIVNISSLIEQAPFPFMAVYAATKVFVRNFTIALQHENRRKGVTIQLVSPGVVRTNMTAVFKSKLVHPNDLISPSAKRYAEQAIGTLGVLDHTAGYPGHNIIFTFLELLPEYMRIRLISTFGQAIVKSEAKIAKN